MDKRQPPSVPETMLEAVRMFANEQVAHDFFVSMRWPGGVVAYNGQTIVMRSSTLTGNAGVGLYYAYVGSGTLDIGTANGSGGNTFAGATTANNNGIAGLRLCGVPAASMLTAAGDAWSSCPPAQTFADCGNAAPKVYSDIDYAPALTSGMPVAVSGCTVGP